jgi:predicted phage terminase large subunit-like protein
LKHARPGDPILVVSPDYNVIQDTTWPTFQRVAEQMGQWMHGVQSPTPRAWFRPVGGGKPCLVVFRSAEKPDKLRGGSWALEWFDEASIMCHEAFTFSIPALRWRGREGTILITMTPKGKSHWTFSLFFVEADEAEREILESDEWDLLENPARYQKIGGKWYRQRDNTGIVQAHSRENPFLPATYEHDIGMHLSAALREQELAGQFIEIAGKFFRREWFELVNEVPRIAQRVRYWDRAATKGGGCFSAGVLMARTDDGLYWVEDVQRGQWSYEERNREIIKTAYRDAEQYGNTVQIWGEQEGGSAGKEVSQQFVKMLAGFPVHIDIVTGKGTRLLDGMELPHKAKIIRSQGMAAQAEAKNVKVKRAAWNEDYLSEIAVFGESDIMDAADASFGAFNKLCRGWTTDPGHTYRIEPVVDGERFGVHLDKSGGKGGRRRV